MDLPNMGTGLVDWDAVLQGRPSTGPRASSKRPVKSASEVKHEARKRSYAIRTAYRTLANMAQRHKPTIQSRWAKKSKQKRLKILLDAWPGMAPSHRPDWEAGLEYSQIA